MCRKLKAEQVRRGITNEDMGKIFGLTRQGYEYKLQNRSFKVDEIHKLCKLFDCSFEYLFEADESEHQK